MTQFVIMATMQPYTVKVQFVEEAEDWSEVLSKRPDAELVRIIEQ